LYAVLVQLLEVVASVSDLVGLDAHKSEILDNGILEFLLLLAGIGVVKTEDERALVLLMRKIVIQQGCLSVADVQITSEI
jgi:hypothetical protein